MKRALRWTAKTKQRLVEVIRRGLYLRSGASCIFIPLNKEAGLKIYKTKGERDRTAKLQAFAAGYGLAPQVGDCFDLECLTINHFEFTADGEEVLGEESVQVNMVYGYVTERARLIRRYKWENMLVWMEIIADELEEIGIVHPDLGPHNMGYINGRLICLDFDSNSCRRRPGRSRKVQGCNAQMNNGS
jgi:hypothetical protein